MKRLDYVVTSLAALAAQVAMGCADPVAPPSGGEDLDGDGKADDAAPSVSNDNLNGLWDGTLDGRDIDDAVIRSWSSAGIVMDIDGKTVTLTRTAGKLKAGTTTAIAIEPNEAGQADDELVGTLDGREIALTRDVEVKPTIELRLPGDRTFRQYLYDTLMPEAQRDRESYVLMNAEKIQDFMESTVLYQSGSFQRKYMKGTNTAQRNAEFKTMIEELDGMEASPRSIVSNPKFSSTVKAHLKDQSLAGLALVNFNLYFTTAAGRSLVLPFPGGTKAYFITDRPSRGEKIGLVVMDTPTHGPLASTFGRQLLDLGEMPPADTVTYARAMMELLAKSDASSTDDLSDVGQSALVDWYSVMAIEDYRGVAFGNANLGWGYNLTNAQFYGLITRVLGQLIIGNELRPGEPSYVDVLNDGNDMREYPDMAKLKKLTSNYLRAQHAAEVAEVEAAFAGIVPRAELDERAKTDIFHFICAQLYDSEDRTLRLTGESADRAVRAVTALFAALASDSAGLEAYLLTQGITKSSTPAPKATGF